MHALKLTSIAMPVIFSAWAFSGSFAGGKNWILLSMLPCVVLGFLKFFGSSVRWGRFWVFIPWFIFAGLVICSYFNPSYKALLEGGFIRIAHSSSWPSSVNPDKTLHQLLFLTGLMSYGIAAYLLVDRRQLLKQILWIVLLNVFALAIVGIYLKITGNPNVLGIVKGPDYYFSSFPYKNHWASYTLLGLSVSLSLFFYYFNRSLRQGNWMHGLHYLCFSLALFLLISVFMSGSRVGTLLFLLLTLLGVGRLFAYLIIGKYRKSALIPVVFSLVGMIAVGFSLSQYFGSDYLNAQYNRFLKTLHHYEEGKLSEFEKRELLYRDTFKMYQAKPMFGWGLASFRDTFPKFQGKDYGRSYTVSNAHNEWLEILAETGVMGMVLLLSPFILITLFLGGLRNRSIIRNWLFIGLLFLGCHAMIDFPLANPAIATLATCVFAVQSKNLGKQKVSNLE